MDIKAELNRVFTLEINTLNDVQEMLDGAYVEAVEFLFKCKGKIVITGMGKSGLIARKIVSTMISTGTKATYLHPADAIHGDLGVLQPDDILLAISKSGETEEVLNILGSVKQMQVPIIAITANRDSLLARQSNVVLFTPISKEACPLNLAPTSSTTAALVVGDSISMVLMKMRGFQSSSFAMLHPGGQLGKRLILTVSDVMRSGDKNPVVHVNDPIKQMLFEITSKQSGAVSVVDYDGVFMGLITDFDIRRIIEEGKDIFAMKIVEIMNNLATFIFFDEKAGVAIDLMENREKPFIVLPVVDRDYKSVGMIHLHDLVVRGL